MKKENTKCLRESFGLNTKPEQLQQQLVEVIFVMNSVPSLGDLTMALQFGSVDCNAKNHIILTFIKPVTMIRFVQTFKLRCICVVYLRYLGSYFF